MNFNQKTYVFFLCFRIQVLQYMKTPPYREYATKKKGYQTVPFPQKIN